MTAEGKATGGDRWTAILRAVVWGGAAVLLAAPRVAMVFTDEVTWSVIDFVVFGAMLVAASGLFELAVRMSRDWFYRFGFGVAVGACFLLVWINLAVGFIGDEFDPLNLMFAGVLMVAAVGAVLSRFEARGMQRAMTATAVAMAPTAAVCVWAGESIAAVAAGVFVVIWLVSALLFGQAARRAQAAA